MPRSHSSLRSLFSRSPAGTSAASVSAATTSAAPAAPQPFTRSADYWRRCGRIETRKTRQEDWCSDGQCVVIHPQLLLTAAHVLFYALEDDENQTPPAPKVPRTQVHAARAPALPPGAVVTATASSASPAAASSSAATAPGSAGSRHNDHYVPFAHVRAVFVEPKVADDGRIIDARSTFSSVRPRRSATATPWMPPCCASRRCSWLCRYCRSVG